MFKFYISLLGVLLSVIWLNGCSSAGSRVVEPITHYPTYDNPAENLWEVTEPLNAPEGLRPCCAFGYDLEVVLAGVNVPFYVQHNIVEIEDLGRHKYNDSVVIGALEAIGLGQENLGLIYSNKGGFIDIAHVRDTIDYTLFLFSHIWPNLGQEFTIILPAELLERHLVFKAFTPPKNPIERYTMAADLAASLAYQLAAWHEVAQWYGYRAITLFPEEVSAFSPEDLYSNLLGSRIARNLIIQGYAKSSADFTLAVDTIFPNILTYLEAQPSEATKIAFNEVDRVWWNSKKRLPNKDLVLYRDYSLALSRYPNMLDSTQGVFLSVTKERYGYVYADIAELQLWPSRGKKKRVQQELLKNKKYLEMSDAQKLADYAEQWDKQHLTRYTLKKAARSINKVLIQ